MRTEGDDAGVGRGGAHRGHVRGVAGQVDDDHVGTRVHAPASRANATSSSAPTDPRPVHQVAGDRHDPHVASSPLSGANFGAGPRSNTRSTIMPSTAASAGRRQHADLGVVDHLAPEREVGDEQRHGEADAAEHRDPGDVAQAEPVGERADAERARASADAPRMPTNLPTTRPTTMPIVTRLDSAWSIASPLSTTPALASAKIGTITKLDTGCSRALEPFEHRDAASRAAPA